MTIIVIIVIILIWKYNINNEIIIWKSNVWK